MANCTIKADDGTILLKCKECGMYKVVNLDNWYFHPEGFLGVLGRCKECIKKGRHSEREREMARVRDKDRYYNDPDRREYVFKTALERRKRKGYGHIHTKTDRKIKKLGIRPNYCPICGEENRIIAHHPDYAKWYEVVFCCQLCHAKIHKGELKAYTVINLLNV